MSVNVGSDGSITRTEKDDEHEMTLHKTKDGAEKLTVKDASGKSLYEGDSAGVDKSALPADLKTKVTRFLKSDSVKVDLGKSGGSGPGMTRTFTLNRADNDNEITLKGDASGRHLLVKEHATGKVLYDGPANKADDYKALPDAVKQKIKAMMEKVQLQFEQ
jgi:hypothetical protein